jgi:hypothetical protein
MKKADKVKIALVKTYKKVLQPVSPNIKKNKKNLELLKSITKFESKSNEFKLIKNLIFDSSLNSKLEDQKLYQLLETKKLLNVDWGKMNKTLNELSHKALIAPNKIKSAEGKRIIKYYEFITGIESEIIKDIFQKQPTKALLYDKNKKLPSVSKIDQGYQKIRKMDDARELFYEMMKSKENSLVETLPKSRQKLRANKTSDPQREKKMMDLERKNKSLLRRMTSKLAAIQKKKQEKKTQLVKISHLKDSCSTCSQKVTKTYKKTMMRKLEKKIERIEQLEKIITNLKKDTTYDIFRISKESHLPYEDAREYVNMMGIKSKKEWDKIAIERKELPVNIPKYPHITYRSTEKKQGWVDWADWLGVKPKKVRSFKETKEFLQKMNINSNHDWVKAVNSGMIPADIPRNPAFVYKKEWKGINHFFNK